MNTPMQPSSTTGASTTAPLNGNGTSTGDNASASRIDAHAERVKQATSQAVNHTKEAVDRAADKVESGLHRATDKAADTAHRTSTRAADINERGRVMYAEGRERADVWLDEARDYVRRKPTQSVAMALGAGWLLGRILRR